MPLLGKYLVFTMILITLSVCATVCVLNIHFRTPSTHSMPPWIKRWCIDILPRYLFMNLPQYQTQQANILPEQLIYLHNPAYATQAVSWPVTLASHGEQRELITSTTREGVMASSNNQCQKRPATSGDIEGYIDNNNTHGLNNSSGHQLSVDKSSSAHTNTTTSNNEFSANNQLKATCSYTKPLLELGTSNLNYAPPGSSTHQQSTLFLPYLQSEAARRLRMQRSRSSDRERSISDNQQSSKDSNNNKKPCDRQQPHQSTSNKSNECSLSADTTKTQQTDIRNNQQQRVTRSILWRFFKSSKVRYHCIFSYLWIILLLLFFERHLDTFLWCLS